MFRPRRCQLQDQQPSLGPTMLERFKPNLCLELHLFHQLSLHKYHCPVIRSGNGKLVLAFGHRPRLPPPLVLLELQLEPSSAFLETTDIGKRVKRLDRRDESGGPLFFQEVLEPDVPGQDSEQDRT